MENLVAPPEVATTAGEAVSEPSAEEDALVEADAAFAALRDTIVAIISVEKYGTQIYFNAML